MTSPARLPDLRDFARIVFFTGAGLSAECGIPTYRGAGGIWQRYRYEDYACQRAFLRDPERVWEFHAARRAQVADCAPGPAHRLIAAVQRAKPGTVVLTQNIDGLHQAAGATDVIELHGSLWRLRCEACGARRESRDVPLPSLRCDCGAWWRPDLVWFEDPLDMTIFHRALTAVEACDCLVAIGTSGVVYPAAELPLVAMQRGALGVEINPEPTPLSALYPVRLQGPAGAMLPRRWPDDGEA